MTKITSAKNILIITVLIVLLAIPMALFMPPAADWSLVFRPAAKEVLAGRTPYIQGYFNAPWTILPLLPLALLPEAWGRGLLAAISIFGFAWAAYKMKARPIGVGLLLISPPVVHCVLNGNIDWLTAMGFVMPPQIGLFFISTKPQMGIVVGLFWLVESWRKGGWREVLRVFLPFTIVLGLSFIFFGLWPIRFEEQLTIWWNASLWPMSIPVGLALLVSSLRKRRIEYAMAASPCLSPYLLLHSWVNVLFAIIRQEWELAAAVLGLWILVLIRA